MSILYKYIQLYILFITIFCNKVLNVRFRLRFREVFKKHLRFREKADQFSFLTYTIVGFHREVLQKKTKSGHFVAFE